MVPASKYLLLTESVGTGKAGDQVNYANVTITGVNAGDLEYEDLTLLAGRLFNEDGTAERLPGGAGF